jgi:hypothetical protein
MNDHEKNVMLYACDGKTLVRHSVIGCVGALPKLIEWEDPDPDQGRRMFVHEAGVSYREHLSFMVPLGELRAVALPNRADENGGAP